MGLSADRRAWLELHYEIWGLDEVRKDLERNDRDLFAHPDVTEFAWTWVEAKEASVRRKTQTAMILVITAILQLGLLVAFFL